MFYIGAIPHAEGSNRSSLTDAIGIGTLTRLVPRELVDEVFASAGRNEIRRNKLPARVVMYFILAIALFFGDAYEEVMRQLADGLDYMGTWHMGGIFPAPVGFKTVHWSRLGPSSRDRQAGVM